MKQKHNKYSRNRSIAARAAAIMLAGLLAGSGTGVLAVQNGWALSQGSWIYYHNGTMLKNTRALIHGKTYAFDAYGNMIQGLYQAADGSLTYHMSSGEAAENTWLKIDNAWYFFDAPEACRSGVYTINHQNAYAFDKNGKMRTGWVQSSQGGWRYFKSDGAMVKKGWLKIGKDYYFFQSPGLMATGWIEDGGKTYFLKSSGEMATGSLTISGVPYTFDSSGALISAENQVHTQTPENHFNTGSNTGSYLSKAEYDQKASAFVQTPRYADGAPWSHENKSELTAFPIGACDGYAYEFIKYVFNYDMTSWGPQENSRADVRQYSISDLQSAAVIQAGDMLNLEFDVYGQHCGHIIMVLQRYGDRLLTAEGNMDGKVVVSDSWYYISNNQLMRRASTNLKIVEGIHFLHQ